MKQSNDKPDVPKHSSIESDLKPASDESQQQELVPKIGGSTVVQPNSSKLQPNDNSADQPINLEKRDDNPIAEKPKRSKIFGFMRLSIGRFTEVIAVLTGLVFIFEVTTADRYFPYFTNLNNSSPQDFRVFATENDGELVYLVLDLHHNDIVEDSWFDGNEYSDSQVWFQGIKGLERGGNDYGVMYAAQMRAHPLIDYTVENMDEDIEDNATYLRGPVLLKSREYDKGFAINIYAAPYTETIANRADCSSKIRQSGGFEFLKTYTLNCMFGFH